MRPPLIVYIDVLGTNSVESIAEAAARHGISTALICPRASWSGNKAIVKAVLETGDFSLQNLRCLLAKLDRRFSIKGLHSSFGPFTADGFLHGIVASLAAERGLPYSSPDALASATNKFLMRSRLAAAGVPDVPHGLATDEASAIGLAERIGYPVILKPLTGVGSSLIYRCNNRLEVRRNWRRAMQQLPHAYYEQLRMAPHTFEMPIGTVLYFDPMRMMLVERYLSGREASVECVVSGRKVVPLVVHDKLLVQEARGVVLEHLLVAPPQRFTAGEVRRLRSHAVSAIKALGLQNMFCHVELRWVKGLGPRVLEVNARIGAGCVGDSIETFTNINVDDLKVRLILGQSLPPVKTRKARRHAMIFLFSPRSGKLVRLHGLDAVNYFPFVRSVRVMRTIGDKVGGNSEEGFLACIWLEVRNENDAHQAYRQIRRAVHIQIA